MKLPAIKGIIGDWIYYQTVISFEKVSELIDNDHSIREYPTLNDVLQRDLSKRSKKIKEYLIREESRFFNSAIIGIYGENPNWYRFDFAPSVIPEMELSTDLLDSIGVLEFNGGEILFSIDGQHRIEGIKQAMKEKPSSFKFDELPVIIIAHNDSKEGKIRTRRLFSEINTKAVRVSGLDDLITNEDHPVNINARKLYTEFEPFEQSRYIALNKTVNIDASSSSFTTILNLRDVNKHLYKNIYNHKDFRPSDTEIDELYNVTLRFWTNAVNNIEKYKSVFIENENEIKDYRSNEGGSMLFRPIGINILAQAFVLWNNNNMSGNFWSYFNGIDDDLNGSIWKDVIWDNAKMNIKKTSVKFIRKFTEYILGIETDTEYLEIEYNKLKGIENENEKISLPSVP